MTSNMHYKKSRKTDISVTKGLTQFLHLYF